MSNVHTQPAAAPLQTPSLIPPLRGDGTGKYRVHIVGNSGAGKSTLARELAAILDVPCVLLDTIYWQPGWGQLPRDDFRRAVRAAFEQDPRGWVVDGNYTSALGTMVSDEATDVIWLDPPFALYFPRLVWRTFLRLFRLAPPCSPGCDERASEVFFSRDSIIWWCLTQHGPVRKRQGEQNRIDGVHVGGRHRRIGGCGSELDAWKREVRAMVETEAQA
ncbi:AAA domain-containing protein [Fomes fomentarius]|nr:AAA domain-containing protein [Fomes fomentarius]